MAGASTGGEAHGRRTLAIDGGSVRWHRPALVTAWAQLAVRDDDESRDGDDEACTLDERRGAKPPRRGAEPPERVRSASRGVQRSVAFFRVQRRFSRSEGGEGLLGLV